MFGGGIIPDEDIPELERIGVAQIFTPGATTTEIVDWVRRARRGPGRRLTAGQPVTGTVSFWLEPRPGGEGDRLRCVDDPR